MLVPLLSILALRVNKCLRCWWSWKRDGWNSIRLFILFLSFYALMISLSGCLKKLSFLKKNTK